ncbi:hypothetical protein [Speluncibacter jeojiensis]|uniref:Uncharacterized protein n=1 Tax=Speluncibacter jeojiensis TaxID=2710754 RepID=A0A9X4RCH7_9ACTN|nr:hypothetical protein [Corynebacteriales bacterium D3-21]
MNDPAEAWDCPDFADMLDHLPKPLGAGAWIVTTYSGYKHAADDGREAIYFEWSRDGLNHMIYLVAEGVR